MRHGKPSRHIFRVIHGIITMSLDPTTGNNERSSDMYYVRCSMSQPKIFLPKFFEFMKWCQKVDINLRTHSPIKIVKTSV